MVVVSKYALVSSARPLGKKMMEFFLTEKSERGHERTHSPPLPKSLCRAISEQSI